MQFMLQNMVGSAPAPAFIATPAFHEFWLPPLMEILGIGLQLFSMRGQSLAWLWSGCCLTALGAAPQKDITLAVGCILASLGLTWAYRQKS